MSKKISNKEIKEKIDDGWIHANIIFEMVGSPQKHIEDSLKLYLDNIKSDEHIIVISEDLEETIEGEEGMFSTAAEVEYLILGLEKLTWLAFNFMPASIDIKAPSELTFRDKDLTAWMGDLLSKLHEVNTIHTSLRAEQQGLVKNLNNAIRNNVLLSLRDEMSAKDIADKIGMKKESAVKFLEKMREEGIIDFDGKKYRKA